MTPAAGSGRLRRRFSRTLSRARWPEYREFLSRAHALGYEIASLEDWVLSDQENGRTLVMRHDVDQAPQSALTMAEIEREHGVTSTWYFRWRTARAEVISRLRTAGFTVGLHYETFTREALRRGVSDERDPSDLIEECREILRREIAAFAARHGPIRSICPHGDSRVPHLRNAALMHGVRPEDLGIEFDGNEAMRGRGLEYWLTDRSRAEGGWNRGARPVELLEQGLSPILCVVHPNNWTSGPALWAARFERRLRRLGDTPPT